MPASFTWQPGPDGGTPTNAANLNKLAVVADIGVAGTPTGDALKAAYGAVYRVDNYGAKGDWTGGVTGSGANDTAAVQALINSVPEGSTVQFTAGKTYRIDNLLAQKSLTIDGNGASLVTSPTGGAAPTIWFTGTTAPSKSFNAATAGASTITLTTIADAGSYTVGQYVFVGDGKVEQKFDGTNSVNVGRGEMNRVTAVNTSTGVLTLESPLEWGYDTSPYCVPVTKMLMQPQVHGFAINEVDPGAAWGGSLAGNCPHLVHFQYSLEPLSERIAATGWNVHVVNFDRCISPIVRDSFARDPFRPASSGHGYFMRFSQAVNGVVENNTSHGARHHVDWANSYGCTSRNNTAYNSPVTSYQTHGIWSKRAISEGDRTIGGTGWSVGDPSFADDHDVSIVNYSYVGSAAAIIVRSKCVGVKIVNPMIRTTGRGIFISEGAGDITVDGGYIQGDTDTILARARSGNGDTFVAEPGSITIRGVRILGATQRITLDSVGRVEVSGCIFDGGSASAGYAIGVGITDNAAPTGVLIRDNSDTAVGTYAGAIRVITPPSGPEYVIERNTLPNHTGATSGILFTPNGNLRLTGNRVGPSGMNPSTSVTASKAAGARYAWNVPPTLDDVAATVGAAGAGAGIALSSTDATVTNARTPTTHAATHASGGADALTPAAIGADAAGAATAAQAFSIQRANHSGTQAAATITGLAAVATSGSYVDLTNKPAGGFATPAPASGQYFFPAQAANPTTSALANGALRLTPFVLGAACSIARIGAEVTTIGDAGSTVRLGIYADNGNGLPGSLLVDAGTISGSTVAAQEVTLGTPLALAAGVYWVASVTQGVTTTAPTLRAVATAVPPIPLPIGTTIPGAGNSSVGVSQSGSVTGALPATFTFGAAAGNTARLFLKVA